MAIGIGAVVRISARFLFNNIDDIVNVIHFVNETGSVVASDDFMDDVADFLDGLYGPLMNRWDTLITANVIDGANVTVPEVLPTTAWPVITAGTSAEDGCPLPVSTEIFFPTTTPKVRGRIFLPPPDEAQSNNGVIASSYVTSLLTFGTGLITQEVGTYATFSYVVYNRVLSTYASPTGAVVPGITRTQRRRRQGVGS